MNCVCLECATSLLLSYSNQDKHVFHNVDLSHTTCLYNVFNIWTGIHSHVLISGVSKTFSISVTVSHPKMLYWEYL